MSLRFADRIVVMHAALDDIVVFKALFNRTKDWADIEAVVEAGTADIAEALDWIERIAGSAGPSYTRLRALVED